MFDPLTRARAPRFEVTMSVPGGAKTSSKLPTPAALGLCSGSFATY